MRGRNGLHTDKTTYTDATTKTFFYFFFLPFAFISSACFLGQISPSIFIIAAISCVIKSKSRVITAVRRSFRSFSSCSFQLLSLSLALSLSLSYYIYSSKCEDFTLEYILIQLTLFYFLLNPSQSYTNPTKTTPNPVHTKLRPPLTRPKP